METKDRPDAEELSDDDESWDGAAVVDGVLREESRKSDKITRFIIVTPVLWRNPRLQMALDLMSPPFFDLVLC